MRRSKTKRDVPKPLLEPTGRLTFKKIFRQALYLFLFSAAFAILFNAFYVEGIPLKFMPPKQTHLMDHHDSPVSSFVGWNRPSAPKTPKPSQTASNPADNIVRISLAGAKDRFDKKSCVFLDARPPEEYKEGHIPGALNFYADDFDKFAPQVLPQLPDKGQEMVAYCHGSTCELSIALAHRLQDIGYTNVKVFFGGWPQWKKSGYPIRQGENP